MNYVITAAGRGSRLVREGIKPPKPLVTVLGKELLLWSLDSFRLVHGDTVIIATLKEDFIPKKLSSKLKIVYPGVKFIWIELEDLTSGQLSTLAFILDQVYLIGPFVVHNCDTSYGSATTNFEHMFANDDFFAIVPYFIEHEKNHWSFLEFDRNAVVTDIREKDRISCKCSVGSYVFSSKSYFLELYSTYSENPIYTSGELYISSFLSFAVSAGKKILAHEVSDVKIFGTVPEIQQSFNISKPLLLAENSRGILQRKTLVVDIDGTICEDDSSKSYASRLPISSVVNSLVDAHLNGAYIILFTSRNVNTYKGNIGLINKYTAPQVLDWLNLHDIPYDEIYFGKPWGDNLTFVDDKACLPFQL